jgi:hypothetical protein
LLDAPLMGENVQRYHLGFRLLTLVACLSGAPLAHAEQAAGQRPLAVLLTTDSSQLNLGERITGLLAQQLQATNLFSMKMFATTLPGYTTEALSQTYAQTASELISFSYVDQQRLALFLFDINRPGRYVATSETLVGAPGGQISEAWLDNQFKRAFSELIKQYSIANFELIPSSEPQAEASKQPEVSREEKDRRLFNEMSKISDGAVYVGANVGMARFSAQGASASSVSVGVLAGIKIASRFRFEGGADLFSYMMLHGDLRFQLPIAERYVSLSLGASANHVTALLTQNRGFNSTYLETGSMLFGPSVSFEVPLLGASIRGDLKLLLGSSTIFLGTYGLSYTL